MNGMNTITDVIASNLEIAAPLAAILCAWFLYGVLGKRFLGADDDFWPIVRGWLLPKLDAVARSTNGLYAEARSGKSEFCGYYIQRLEEVRSGDQAIDPFERTLEQMGYSRNPLAAFKRSPEGWRSAGSWARRYGYIRGTGDIIRALSNPSNSPFDIRWLGDAVGRFLQGLGDILALRQVHVTLYAEELPDAQIVRVHIYAHDEPNSLNPLTALAHYRANGHRPRKGVQQFLDDADRNGVHIAGQPSDK